MAQQQETSSSTVPMARPVEAGGWGRAMRRAPWLGVLVVLLASGCTTRTVVPTDEMAGVAPQLSVERFLQAVSARDYDAMLRLFGTHEGPVDADSDRAYWEQRMDLLARILDFTDYRIVSESSVPARPHPTTRVGVNLSFQDGTVPDVAFVVVRTEAGRWMVGEIDTEKVMRRQ
jgi:hypothetical protein